MRTILYLIRKEFIQIFRNKFISRAVFAVPLVQMLVLVPAVTFEIRNISLAILDYDMTHESRDLITRLDGSTFFNVSAMIYSRNEAEEHMARNKSKVLIEIPEGFGKDIVSGGTAQIMISADAINASAARLYWSFIEGVLRGYSQEISLNHPGRAEALPPAVEISNRFWYNEDLDYKFFMLPGVLVVLVTAIGFLLAGLNMVKEKETGTNEQINVTPVLKYQFITAKMVPFLLIGIADLLFGLTIGILVFDIPFRGSIALLFGSATVFLIAVLGLSLFISTFSGTQQQYMFIAFFFMIVFILMSGIFTPVESMPGWAQTFDLINPVAYLIKINRMVMLKGSGITDIANELISLAVTGIVFMSLAVWRYRKTA